MLAGKAGARCDLVTALFERDINFQLYRGLKNQYLSSVTYVLQLATLGWGLHAGTISMQTDQPYAWTISQNQFQLSHRTALYRIQEFYKAAVSETLFNSQRNLATYIQNNPDIFSQDDLVNITVAVQSALLIVASNKQWFVQVYSKPTDTDMNIIHASKCVECFSVFDVNGTYNIFVAGVDATSEPNPSIQFQDWIAIERSQDYTQDLEAFVADVYGEVCISGVVAVLNSVQQVMAFPNKWPSTGYIIVQDKIKFLVWAVKDQCPGFQESKMLQ